MLIKSPQKRKDASEAANGWTRVSSLLKLERRERDELGALLGVKNYRCCFWETGIRNQQGSLEMEKVVSSL